MMMVTAKGAAAAVFWGLVAQSMFGNVLSDDSIHSNEDGNDNDNANENSQQQEQSPSQSQCSLVMAPSQIDSSGWGVFSLTDRTKGDAVMAGDVVIQVSDLNETHADAAKRLVFDYAWGASETGGQYEGQNVVSLIPGLGMLANGSPQTFHLLPVLEPTVDEAGTTRHSSPGAGAFTHYHNYSFHATHDIQAGEEFLVHYGPAWYEQQRSSDATSQQKERRAAQTPATSLEELKETGLCLDNLKVADSSLPNAGRGAFATRTLAEGSIVAPVPVVAITRREAMDITRNRQISKQQSIVTETKQLLLNYCFSHPQSSVLLFPYAPMVNLINHASSQQQQDVNSDSDTTAAATRPNVRLQWSSASQQHERLSLEDLEQINKDSTTSGGLLMELVAIREIQEGDEIVMDYGNLWQEAWNQHVLGWTPYEKSYAPAYAMDEETQVLSTSKEQKESPYPPNMITSCFYRYHKDDPALKARGDHTRNITTAEWRLQPGLFELRNLRPCTVMQREEIDNTKDDSSDDEDKESTYTYSVIIRNRYGLQPDERVPADHVHIATTLPRRAIRFTDKLYTTDQHLVGAFRHEIGLPEGVFPEQWMV